MGPRPHFICCEVSFLIRTNVWNTTIMNKTFFKSTDDSFGKGFHEEKVNLYLEYLNKNKGPKKKKKEQMAGPSVVEAVQHNQPTTRYLVYYHEV